MDIPRGILALMDPLSVYIHIPFCKSRCGYCDFNTYAGVEYLIDAYASAVCRELTFLSQNAPEDIPIKTIFFGGGTPSIVPEKYFEQIFDTIFRFYRIIDEAEISLEANPWPLTYLYLKRLRQLGFNRISIGMQSAIRSELRLLDRRHDFCDVSNAVEWSRRAGFENLNLDLIFGLPGQKVRDWMESLQLAVGFQPEHLSLYALTIEEGTVLGGQISKGLLPSPDEDIAAEIYEWTMEYLASEFTQYEISNWAHSMPDNSSPFCNHNLQYWHNQPYLGFGAGAHGWFDHKRLVNVLTPVDYIRAIGTHKKVHFPHTPATTEINLIDIETEMQETMMLGLRLTQEGVKSENFYTRFGKEMEVVFEKEISDLCSLGLLEWSPGRKSLRLSYRGRFLGNQVFLRFV
jgi:oxygen-independent coproporphyrinogen-3 oxidase